MIELNDRPTTVSGGCSTTELIFHGTRGGSRRLISDSLTLFICVKPLYTNEEFLFAKLKDKLLLVCYQCGTSFLRTKKIIQQMKRCSNYCSRTCVGKSQRDKQILTCNQCNTQFIRIPSQIRSVNTFCSQSCAVTYNNTHKTKGCRVSKLELFLQSELVKKYPTLVFDFNKKDAINSELDIYIPSLKLAFELNGIFHYEPIYGKEKFCQIQNNDNRKFQACLERGIELCIIDTSSVKHFAEKRAMVYFDIITNIIVQRTN